MSSTAPVAGGIVLAAATAVVEAGAVASFMVSAVLVTSSIVLSPAELAVAATLALVDPSAPRSTKLISPSEALRTTFKGPLYCRPFCPIVPSHRAGALLLCRLLSHHELYPRTSPLPAVRKTRRESQP